MRSYATGDAVTTEHWDVAIHEGRLYVLYHNRADLWPITAVHYCHPMQLLSMQTVVPQIDFWDWTSPVGQFADPSTPAWTKLYGSSTPLIDFPVAVLCIYAYIRFIHWIRQRRRRYPRGFALRMPLAPLANRAT
jgi:hypothetical protein